MRLSKLVKIAVGILAGVSLLTLAGPVVGETIATLPPSFTENKIDPITEAGLSFEDVAFPTSNGLSLRGWFIPAERPGEAPTGET